MKVNVSEQSFSLTLAEVVEIVNGRLDHVHMENPKNNPLVTSYNDGADMMAKYIKDYFMNEFDSAAFREIREGGNENG